LDGRIFHAFLKSSTRRFSFTYGILVYILICFFIIFVSFEERKKNVLWTFEPVFIIICISSLHLGFLFDLEIEISIMSALEQDLFKSSSGRGWCRVVIGSEGGSDAIDFPFCALSFGFRLQPCLLL